jgi:peptidoglycan/LPS O-acetylase OafA/YrhL
MSQKLLSYRPEIDGLRAVAITAVVVYHAGVKWIGGGFVGVDIFFVISGYLIGFIIHSDISAGHFTFAQFYARRAKRILPALLALIALLYFPVAVLMTPSELTTYAWNALSALGAISNIQFWRSTSYFAPNAEWNPMLMTWSLGVEEQFYILFPLVLLLLRKAVSRMILSVLGTLVFLSFCISVWCIARHPGVGFYLLPARAWELGLGTMLAVWHSERAPTGPVMAWLEKRAFPLIGVTCIVVSVLTFNAQMDFPGWIALVPTAGAVSLIASKNNLLTAVLGNRIPAFVGKISYSWYLWHWPILSLARICSSEPLSLGATTGLVFLSLLLAVLSWRFVEQPFRHSRRPSHQLLPLYGTALLVAAVPAIAIVFLHGWPQRFDKSVAGIEAFAQERHAQPCLNDYGMTALQTDSRCQVKGFAPDSVILIGDSHAASLSPVVREKALKQGLGFRQITKSACPPLEGVTSWMPSHPLHASECALFNKLAMASVLNDSSVTSVVVAANWSRLIRGAKDGMRYAPVNNPSQYISEETSETDLKIGLTNLVSRLTSAGKKVILVEDNPIFDFDPLRWSVAQKIPARFRLGEMLSYDPVDAAGRSNILHVINAHDVSISIVREVQAGIPGVQLVDPFGSLCAKAECMFSDNGGLYYFDEQHLSALGATIELQSLKISTPANRSTVANAIPAVVKTEVASTPQY